MEPIFKRVESYEEDKPKKRSFFDIFKLKKNENIKQQVNDTDLMNEKILDKKEEKNKYDIDSVEKQLFNIEKTLKNNDVNLDLSVKNSDIKNKDNKFNINNELGFGKINNNEINIKDIDQDLIKNIPKITEKIDELEKEEKAIDSIINNNDKSNLNKDDSKNNFNLDQEMNNIKKEISDSKEIKNKDKYEKIKDIKNKKVKTDKLNKISSKESNLRNDEINNLVKKDDIELLFDKIFNQRMTDFLIKKELEKITFSLDDNKNKAIKEAIKTLNRELNRLKKQQEKLTKILNKIKEKEKNNKIIEKRIQKETKEKEKKIEELNSIKPVISQLFTKVIESMNEFKKENEKYIHERNSFDNKIKKQKQVLNNLLNKLKIDEKEIKEIYKKIKNEKKQKERILLKDRRILSQIENKEKEIKIRLKNKEDNLNKLIKEQNKKLKEIKNKLDKINKVKELKKDIDSLKTLKKNLERDIKVLKTKKIKLINSFNDKQRLIKEKEINILKKEKEILEKEEHLKIWEKNLLKLKEMIEDEKYNLFLNINDNTYENKVNNQKSQSLDDNLTDLIKEAKNAIKYKEFEKANLIIKKLNEEYKKNKKNELWYKITELKLDLKLSKLNELNK